MPKFRGHKILVGVATTGTEILSRNFDEATYDLPQPKHEFYTEAKTNESFLLPTLSHLRVRKVPVHCLRLWCSARYQRISPLHRAFHAPLTSSSLAVSRADPPLGGGI